MFSFIASNPPKELWGKWKLRSNWSKAHFLGELELPVEGEMELYVKQSEREEGNDDDFIILAAEDDFIDLSSYLYEVYMLNYPMRVVHPEGECDSDMQDMLDNYIVEENDKPNYPRWYELKKLINN